MTSFDFLRLAGTAVGVRKRPVLVRARFARIGGVCDTLEGPVRYNAGDVILTGSEEESWPITASNLSANYLPAGDVPMGRDGDYVKKTTAARAVRLQEPLAVVGGPVGDILQGGAGDWLLEYEDGTVGIVRASVFDRTYEIE